MPTTLCDNCCQALPMPLVCARCKTARCKTSTCSKDCQIKAWKAGHKGECVTAARADTRTAAKPTADQTRVLKILKQLDGAANWRGVAAQERAARAVAAAVRTSMPRVAAWVFGTLGNAYQKLGSAWRLQRRWATGRGRAMRTRTLGARISRRRTSA